MLSVVQRGALKSHCLYFDQSKKTKGCGNAVLKCYVIKKSKSIVCKIISQILNKRDYKLGRETSRPIIHIKLNNIEV